MREAASLGVPQLENDRIQFLAHFKVKDINTLEHILKANPVSFANVRHPFERLASAFLDTDNGELNRLVKRNNGFEKFIIDYVLAPAESSQDMKRLFELNHHWRPFNSHCSFCNINYTIISKTETFAEDKTRIMDILGLQTKITEKRRNSHSGNRIEKLTQEIFRNVSVDVKLALLELYKFDFEMFKYSPYQYY